MFNDPSDIASSDADLAASLRARLADLPPDAPEPSFKARLSVPIVATIHLAREGGFWAEVPSLPGCYTQGETLDEIKSNIVEAATLWLESNEEAEAARAAQGDPGQ